MSAQLNKNRIVSGIAMADQQNGTETRSNLIAYSFWKKLGRLFNRFRSRRCLNELYNMFISSSLFPEDLAETPRCFNQVLFSLVHDGKICRVTKGQIHWKFNWRLCDPLDVRKEKSCVGMDLDEHVVEVAEMFFTENTHSLRQLRNHREIKFFYELWSSTHDSVVLACADLRDVPTKVDPGVLDYSMYGIPLFGRILFALSSEKKCRVIYRDRLAPIVHWTMNDKFYQKKHSFKDGGVSSDCVTTHPPQEFTGET